MDCSLQYTLNDSIRFIGKGLHTGAPVSMILKPAPVDFGIRFHRVDLGEDAFVQAAAEHISNTARSTSISCGEVTVVTIEHLMSALTGLGVDNLLIELDGPEVPILDGSARLYAEAISATGLKCQDSERKFIRPSQTIEVKDSESGAFVRIEPADSPSYDITVDFGSKVLGVQHASWTPSSDFASEIACCRTFVFFHELEFLASKGLIKGGDVDNAIVIVEHPVTSEQIDRIGQLLGRDGVEVREGYLSNVSLHFPDECGRHKLLDLIGDLRLCGGFLCARVTAFKPGHTINAAASKALVASLKTSDYE